MDFLNRAFQAILDARQAAATGLVDLVTDPVDVAKRAGEKLLSNHAEFQGQMGQAFSDPKNPLQLTNQAALAKVAESMMNGPLGMAPAGITLWHGSPHRFEKFDSSKIGTGEGNQAYGQGLYLAQNPKVAEMYRKGVPTQQILDAAQFQFDPSAPASELYRDLMLNGGLNRAQQRLLYNLKKDDFLGFDYPHQAVNNFARNPQNFDASPGTFKALEQVGQMYKVHMPDAMEAKMLPWDAPPPTSLIKKLAREDVANGMIGSRREALEALTDYTSVRELYRAAGDSHGGPSGVSEHLKGLGFPGIKYMDGVSRKGLTEPTFNYVVFPGNERYLRIEDAFQGPPR